MSILSTVILDLDGAGITTLAAPKSKAKYDFDGDGLADDTPWIGSTEGFLFLDRDSNGTLTNASELSFTQDVTGALTSLAGLKAFDSNNDNKLSIADARFADFRVWKDTNGNGAVNDGEVLTLTAAGVTSIEFSTTAINGEDKTGEISIVSKGSYTRTNGTKQDFIDARINYLSAASNLADIAMRNYNFEDSKDKKFRLSISGGTISVVPKNGGGVVDKAAGQLGYSATMTFKNKSWGMLSAVVLDLDGNGVDLKTIKESQAGFDLNRDGGLDDSGWISKRDAFLVIDRNKDGKITDAAELSLGAEDKDAASALKGLALLDSNSDGVIDAKDARFGELSLWNDANDNGITDAGELRSLTDLGIASIKLASTPLPDKRLKLGNNAILSTTSFTRTDGSTGTVGDVALAFKPGPPPAVSAEPASSNAATPAGYMSQLVAVDAHLMPLVIGAGLAQQSAVDPNAVIPFSQGNLATVPSDIAATDMTFTSPFSSSAEQFARAIAAFAGTTGISELSGSPSMLDGVGSITIPSVLQER